jgi:hypothetical protein
MEGTRESPPPPPLVLARVSESGDRVSDDENEFKKSYETPPPPPPSDTPPPLPSSTTTPSSPPPNGYDNIMCLSRRQEEEVERLSQSRHYENEVLTREEDGLHHRRSEYDPLNIVKTLNDSESKSPSPSQKAENKVEMNPGSSLASSRWHLGLIDNYTIIDKVGSGTYGYDINE